MQRHTRTFIVSLYAWNWLKLTQNNRLSCMLQPLSKTTRYIQCKCEERCNFYLKMHQKLFGGMALPGQAGERPSDPLAGLKG